MENQTENIYFQKQKEVFEPLLQNFYEKVKDLKNEAYPPAIFLPQVCEDYGTEGKKRVFYVGRDTLGWYSWYKKMLSNTPAEYLQINNQYLLKNKYAKNKKSVFWRMCQEIQISMQWGNFTGFGWGNRNSIEVENQAKYKEIKKASIRFDKLEYILKCYLPEIVFILSWSNEGKKAYFEGLKPSLICHNSEEKPKIRIYEVDLPEQTQKTKVIWTEHPSSLRYKGVGIKDAVQSIKNILQPYL